LINQFSVSEVKVSSLNLLLNYTTGITAELRRARVDYEWRNDLSQNRNESVSSRKGRNPACINTDPAGAPGKLRQTQKQRTKKYHPLLFCCRCGAAIAGYESCPKCDYQQIGKSNGE